MNFAMLLKAADALVALADAARHFKSSPASDTRTEPPSPDRRSESALAEPAIQMPAAQLEARLTGVVVAALKEAFNRDHARLELERAQMDEQRRRAEAALQAELRRQATERELGRLRLLAATALVGWLASVLVLGLRAAEATTPARAALAVGWVLLLGALGTSFTAQGRVGTSGDDAGAGLQTGRAATAAVWLLVAGLATTAISLLL
jgi:hypothetical protein